jgi:hypothetical protein
VAFSWEHRFDAGQAGRRAAWDCEVAALQRTQNARKNNAQLQLSLHISSLYPKQWNPNFRATIRFRRDTPPLRVCHLLRQQRSQFSQASSLQLPALASHRAPLLAIHLRLPKLHLLNNPDVVAKFAQPPKPLKGRRGSAATITRRPRQRAQLQEWQLKLTTQLIRPLTLWLPNSRQHPLFHFHHQNLQQQVTCKFPNRTLLQTDQQQQEEVEEQEQARASTHRKSRHQHRCQRRSRLPFLPQNQPQSSDAECLQTSATFGRALRAAACR